MLFPLLLDDIQLAEVFRLLDHIQLHQLIDASLLCVVLHHDVLVVSVGGLNELQPTIYQAERFSIQHGLDAPAAIMTAQDDMAHLQHLYGELHHAHQVDVLAPNHIGNVSVHEHIARIGVGDLRGRHPGIGASNPEKVRLLMACQIFEVVGVALHDALRPCFVFEK